MTQNKQWIRYRFKTHSYDVRPLSFNPAYPWWESGWGADDSAIIIAYLPDDEDLLQYWDDAFDVDHENREAIEFSDRFPCPDWYQPLG